AGLRALFIEAAVLSERARSQNPAFYRRRRARYGARHRRHRCLCHLKARTKKGRDAVRSPQTHPEARPPAIARTERRPRRVPPRRDRSEPPQTRQADPNTRANPGVRSRARATPTDIEAAPGPAQTFSTKSAESGPPKSA